MVTVHATYKKKATAKKRSQQIKLQHSSSDGVKFPPKPPSEKLLHKIISGFCADSSPDAFQEASCAVCGELHLLTNLVPLSDSKADLNLLIKSDMTRKLRKSSSCPIAEIEGPILYKNCQCVCTDCEISLTKGKIPLLMDYGWVIYHLNFKI